MIIDSAWVTMLQLWPALLSAVDITAKPRESATVGLELPADAPSVATVSEVTLGAVPAWWSMPQLEPWVISSLWFQPLLRRPRRPRLLGVEEDGDLVLVAVLVAGLDADDERHLSALVGVRRGDVRGRVLRVVFLEAPPPVDW